MPSKIQAISPLVDRLMRLIQGSQCVPGDEFDVELALREALGNAVVHGNQEDPEKKVHIRCRCQPGNQIYIVVTDQGKGFDFGKMVCTGFTSDPSSEHGRGIQLMKGFMDDVHFESGGSEFRIVAKVCGQGKAQAVLRRIICLLKDGCNRNVANHGRGDGHRTKVDARTSVWSGRESAS
jgi:serine/threonine-protein kinase RsbW